MGTSRGDRNDGANPARRDANPPAHASRRKTAIAGGWGLWDARESSYTGIRPRLADNGVGRGTIDRTRRRRIAHEFAPDRRDRHVRRVRVCVVSACEPPATGGEHRGGGPGQARSDPPGGRGLPGRGARPYRGRAGHVGKTLLAHALPSPRASTARFVASSSRPTCCRPTSSGRASTTPPPANSSSNRARCSGTSSWRTRSTGPRPAPRAPCSKP